MKSTPYASATSGHKARDDIEQVLLRFGCEKINGAEGIIGGGRHESLCCRRLRPDELAAPSFAWWVAQIKHVLPPKIFFFVGFNLILWTKQLILKEHGIDFSGFVTATFAALLIGKAVLVTDNLPFMHRFDGAPLIQPILKTVIYW